MKELLNEMFLYYPSPILSIPGISYRMGAMILAEIGDFTRFNSPDQILAYAGLSPSTYQSGKLTNAYPHMEKRGSRYLRYALYNATKYVYLWDPTFAASLKQFQHLIAVCQKRRWVTNSSSISSSQGLDI